MEFRHEYKFMITYPQSVLLQARLQGLMQKDGNAKETGGYEIRSIYFDDIKNSCYYANEAGVDPRVKYRIRAYNASDARIVLEKKIKQNGMTRKLHCPLTKEEYRQLLMPIHAEEPQNRESQTADKPLLAELWTGKRTVLMEPKVIVVYRRIPYVEAAGNVRITFDEGMASSVSYEDFFEKELHARPIMPDGRLLMEVKYDEFLPAHIKRALDLGKLTQTTFSKYYLCRRYHL